MSWHLDHAVLGAYRAGRLGDVAADSVEAHLNACDACRLTVEVDDGRRDRVWCRVLDGTLTPKVRRGERVLRRVGVDPASSRLLAMTPSVRPSWLVSVVMVVTLAMVVSRNFDGGPVMLLLVAPLVPVAGVAASFGPGTDPVYEVGLASPTGGLRLLLLRAVVVLAVSSVAVAAPATVLLEFRWTAACLLPALAVTLLTLLLSSVVTPGAAAAAVSASWSATVAAVAVGPTLDSLARGVVQLVFGALVAVLAVGLVVRRQAFECP
jgi:hypothetical protein